jgi:hypothetical protein
MEPADLLAELHSILEHRHIKSGHDAIATVNRLLQKHPGVAEHCSGMQLPPERTSIQAEAWSIDRLVALLHPSQVRDANPTLPTGAVVVVQHKGWHYMVDGRRRVNYWSSNGLSGPHRVLVLSVEA